MTNHLRSPPVIEAIVDFIFESNMNKSLAGHIASHCVATSERREPFHNYKIDLQKVDKDANTLPKVEKADGGGVRYFYESGKYVITTKSNGITFGRLKPYSDFPSFKSWIENKANAFGFNNLSEPKISRIGVRYINSFIIPVSGKYAKDYLFDIPPVPHGLIQEPVDFVSRVTVPISDLEATCILTQTLAPASDGKSSQVTIDIDVFKLFKQSVGYSTTWSQIEALKAQLNSVFFRTVTKRTLDIFL